MADHPNSQFGSDVEYNSLDRGTAVWAVKKGPDAIPAIPLVPGAIFASEDFEGIPWSSGLIFLVSNTGWFVTSADSYSGTKCYESQDVVGPLVSEFTIEDFTFSPQLSFMIKAENFVPSAHDKFEVLFDGTPVYTITSDISDWTRIAIPTNFAFDITFRATQNFPIGTDYFVRLDDIGFGDLDTPGVPGSPAHPLVYAPLHLTNDGERLKVSAKLTGTVVIDDYIPIQVEVVNPSEQRPLTCETDAVTACIDQTVQVHVDNPVTHVTATIDNPVTSVAVTSIPEVEIKNDTGNPVPVTYNLPVGTLNNGVQTAVAASAVQVAAANANRKAIIIQNVGIATVRVGVAGVTATTGVRLLANGHVTFSMPNCPDEAIFAIREGSISSTVLVQEVTT